MIVDDGLPESVLIVIVVERSRCLELLELFIGNWEALLAVEAFQIVAKRLANRIGGVARDSGMLFTRIASERIC